MTDEIGGGSVPVAELEALADEWEANYTGTKETHGYYQAAVELREVLQQYE